MVSYWAWYQLETPLKKLNVFFFLQKQTPNNVNLLLMKQLIILTSYVVKGGAPMLKRCAKPEFDRVHASSESFSTVFSFPITTPQADPPLQRRNIIWMALGISFKH